MKRRRQGPSELESLNELERKALEDGFYPELAFDNAERHRDTWERVKSELLAHYAENRPGERPEAWFKFVGEPTYGPRLETVVPRVSESGYPYESLETETDIDYLVRHGILTESERLRIEQVKAEGKTDASR